ncbi:hypothetical protein AB0H86_09755 [Streptomyces sp. NPDC050997]
MASASRRLGTVSAAAAVTEFGPVVAEFGAVVAELGPVLVR